MKKFTCAALLSTALLLSTGCGGSSSDDSVNFRVVISILEGAGFITSTGDSVPVVLAPGAAAVHMPGAAPFFITGEPSSPGLEIMAEDGGGMLLAEEADAVDGVSSTVTFAVPVGATEGGPLTPGGSYEFEVTAEPGEHLSLATMFVQSNDLFIAPSPAGIPLFDEDGNARSGEFIDANPLWDAGTEVDEEPGVGPNQAPRQAGPNTGEDQNGVVTLISEGDIPTIPPLGSILSITIEPIE